MSKVKISEIFFSIQGEGIYIGTPQIFVRFFGCNIKCSFCDTGLLDFYQCDIPALKKAIADLRRKNSVRYLCLTGGEPLLQTDFIYRFLKDTRFKDLDIYLETNGLMDKEIGRLKNFIDILAVDIKLPSATKQGEFWQKHERFLKQISDKRYFAKSVVTLSTKNSDIKRAASLLKKINKKSIFILQPNHFELGVELVMKTINFQKIALDYLHDVRIIPQVHKILGVR